MSSASLAMNRLLNYTTSGLNPKDPRTMFINVHLFSASDSAIIDRAIQNNSLAFLPSGSLVDVSAGKVNLFADVAAAPVGSSVSASGNFVFINPLTKDRTNFLNSNFNIFPYGGTNMFSKIQKIMQEAPITPDTVLGTTNVTFYIQPTTGGWFLIRTPAAPPNPSTSYMPTTGSVVAPIYALAYNPMNRELDSSTVDSGQGLTGYQSILTTYCQAINYADPVCFCTPGDNYSEAAIFGSMAETRQINAQLQQSSPESLHSLKTAAPCHNGVCANWATSSGNEYAQSKTSNCDNLTLTICDTNFSTSGQSDTVNLTGANITETCGKTHGGGGNVSPPNQPITPITPNQPNTPIAPSPSVPKAKENTMLYIGIGGVALFIILALILVISQRRRTATATR